MPCRRPGGERFLLLERAVSLQSSPSGGGSIGPKEVDALVAKLGEVLQLSAQHHRTPPPRIPKHHGRDRAAPYSAPRGLGFFASLHRQPPHQRPQPSLLLLPTPPPTTDKAGSPRVAKQLCGRGWLRSASRNGGKKPRRRHHPLLPDDDNEEEDPHRLLQQLILSGNLIKEAVRRLQLAAAASTSAGEASTTGSPSSASSTGSCHSSSGEGDSTAPPATTAAFAVSSLQPLP